MLKQSAIKEDMKRVKYTFQQKIIVHILEERYIKSGDKKKKKPEGCYFGILVRFQHYTVDGAI